MYCNQCGTNVPEGSKFCNVCGKEIAVERKEDATTVNKEDEELVKEAEKWYDFLLNNKYLKITETDNVKWNDLNNQTEKPYMIKLIKSGIKALQPDEKIVFAFAGMNRFSALLLHRGLAVCFLTNRRLLVTCVANNIFETGTVGPYKMLLKNPPCAKESVYLEDLKGITADMVKGKDVIRIETKKESFNIRIFMKNSQELCDKLNEVITSLRNQ